MEGSRNLLDALEKMLAMKNPAVDTLSEPGPSRKRPRDTDLSNPPKKSRLEQSVKKSIDNTFASIPIRVIHDIDMNEFLAQTKDEIHQKISEELNETKRSQVLY